MQALTYEKLTQPFRENPKLAQSVHRANQILTGLVFLAYPLLLIYLFWEHRRMRVLSVLVPLSGFLAVSAVRRLINRPRPYERFGLPPVIPKDTRGKSFPSRHVFSAAVIAATFLVQGEAFLTGAGVGLMITALALGAIRVLSGVHYVSDVLAALVCAGIGWASYYIWL